MMFVLFGVTTKMEAVEEGEFGCLHCDCRTPYIRKRRAKHFTLFLIPLFPVMTDDDFVQCQRCLREFHPMILDDQARSETNAET